MYNVVDCCGNDLRIISKMLEDSIVGLKVRVYSAENGGNNLRPKFLKETVNVVVKNTDKFSVRGLELYKSKKLSFAIDKDVYVYTKKLRDLVDFKISKPFCRKMFIFESDCQSLLVCTEGYKAKVVGEVAFVDDVELKLSGFSCSRLIEKTAKNYVKVSLDGYDTILSDMTLILNYELKEGTPVVIEGEQNITIRYVDSTDTLEHEEGKYMHWLRSDRGVSTEL